MVATEQRKRIENAFREAHRKVLKPRGYALKKMTSLRRGEVVASVRVELTPGARDAHYPVEVVYLAGVPTAANEPVDLVWGVTGSIPDASGHPRFMVHQFGDDDLVALLAGRIERDAVPFLDRLTTVDDLVEYFSGDWSDAEQRYLEPQSPVKRLKYLTYFASVAGRQDLAETTRARLVAAAEAEAMAADVPFILTEIDERLARTTRP